MLTLEAMIQRKKELGLSCRQISEISGVPLGTVQKIFSGKTTSPRHQTLKDLNKAFPINYSRPTEHLYSNPHNDLYDNMVAETSSYGVSKNPLDLDSYEGKTLEDYMALPEGTRIEMIDGVFYDMSAPTFVHRRIGNLIQNIFENYITKNGGPCIAITAPTDVQLDCDDKTMVQPDVFVICDRKKITKPRVVGAPDLVIEILSPSNWYMDMIRKLKKYKNAGVREYWIVIPDKKSIVVYNFEKSDDFIEYTFEDMIPVGIWNGDCTVDFKEIYDKISFLLD